MKKILVTIIAICLLIVCFPNNVSADDFADDEDYYYTLCSSSTLSSSQIDTCRDFSSYLTEKSDDLQDDIDDAEDELDSLETSLTSIASQIEETETAIEEQEKQLEYLNASIVNLEEDIETKEDTIKERMYAMQSYMNSDSFLQFIFSSSSFSDMFSRISSINELTAYDNELIESLLLDKAQLDDQKDLMSETLISLEADKEAQVTLQAEYNALFDEQLALLESATASSDALSDDMKIVEDAISASFAALNTSSSTGSSSSYEPGDSELGNAIAELAISKLGCLYWWGAPGGGYGDGQGLDNPNAIYFDCSGLVAWAHRQAGVSLVRTTANSYSKMGTAVSYSDLQAGDVVTFNGGSGTVFHIGIYIGNGMVIHASGYGSTTLGNKVNECVKISSLASLDAALGVCNYRRLY